MSATGDLMDGIDARRIAAEIKCAELERQLTARGKL